MERSAGPPPVPEAHERLAGARRHQRLHAAAGGKDHPVRPAAREPRARAVRCSSRPRSRLPASRRRSSWRATKVIRPRSKAIHSIRPAWARPTASRRRRSSTSTIPIAPRRSSTAATSASWGDFLTAIQNVLADQQAETGRGHPFPDARPSPLRPIAEQIALIRRPIRRRSGTTGMPSRATPRGAAGAAQAVRADLSLRQGRRHRHARRGFPHVRRRQRPLLARLRQPPPRRDRRAHIGRPAAAERRAACADEPAVRDREHADADGREGGSPPRAARLGDRSRRAGVVRGRLGGSFSNANAQKFIAAAAKDLQAHRGRSLVIAGDYQPAAVHQLAHALNQSLGNIGTTITVRAGGRRQRRRTRSRRCASSRRRWTPARSRCSSSSARTRSSPRRPTSSSRRSSPRSGLSVSHTLYIDETATLCHWNLPLAHPLESWGDARAYDGTVTVMQPLIAPLYEGRTVPEVLAAFIEAQSGKTRARSRSRTTGRARTAGKVGGWAITDPTGQPFKSADSFWKHVLHDGWIAGNGDRGTAAGTAARQPRLRLDIRRIRRPSNRDPQPRLQPACERVSRSSSGQIPPSGTAASRTTAGSRSCRSR